MNFLHATLLCLCIENIITDDSTNKHEKNLTTEVVVKSDLLSRRKRFLIFDEGSSFQLVFCVTYPHLAEIGDILLWGYTAALAYELPQDPYSPFDHKADPLHRRMDSKTVFYIDETGKIVDRKPYRKKIIVNPAFAKRSVDTASSEEGDEFKNETEVKFKIDRKQMHASKHKREFLKEEHMDGRSVEFHRRSRSLLYRKIETMLQGLGANGRHCMLKTLCLVGQARHNPQGSFFQEILRATFTLPKATFEDEDDKDYDVAHNAKEDCDVLYPECSDPIGDPA